MADGLIYKKFIPGESHTLYYVPNGIKGELIIPEGVDKIGDEAFYQCVNLTTLDLPKSLCSLYYYKSGYGISFAFSYYDINGRRYAEAQRGFNIVVYPDGTTEKVVVK